MKTFEEFEEAWQSGTPPAQREAPLAYIGLRKGDDRHEMPERAELSCERGLVGDRWSDGAEPELDSQITLMNARVAELIARPGHAPGASGDNLYADLDLSESNLSPGDRLQIGDALLEVTEEPHLGCKKFSARFGADALRWVNSKANRSRHLRGIHLRVVRDGAVRVGDIARIISPH